jgi:hypothetical protein
LPVFNPVARFSVAIRLVLLRAISIVSSHGHELDPYLSQRIARVGGGPISGRTLRDNTRSRVRRETTRFYSTTTATHETRTPPEARTRALSCSDES